MSYAFEIKSHDVEGGAHEGESAHAPISRDEAEYFLESTYGVDLDEFQTNALFAQLPPLNIMVDDSVAASHPHLDNTPGRMAIDYMHMPDATAIARAARRAHDFAAVVRTDLLRESAVLSPYDLRIWQTHGDLAFVLATAYDIAKNNKVGGMVAPKWHHVVDSTETWVVDDDEDDDENSGSASVKKGGDVCVHLRGRSETSPYLTP